MEKMPMNPAIGVDGSRRPRLNMLYCVFGFVDAMNGKIIIVEIAKKQPGFKHGNFFTALNTLEIDGFRRVRLHWKRNSLNTAKASAHVHDRYGKARKLIQELWDTGEYKITCLHEIAI
jgi:hypothetical protein